MTPATDIRRIIAERSKQRAEPIHIASLGCDASILRLKTRQMLDLSKLKTDRQGVAMVAQCVLDDEGKPVFADAAAVEELDWSLAQELVRACMQVNALGPQIEAAAKN